MAYSIRVSDHMLRSPYLLDIDTNLAEAGARLRDSRLDCAPVSDAGNLAGVVTLRDLQVARAVGASEWRVRLRDLPLHHAYVTTPDATIQQVAQAMIVHKIEYALVQEHDALLGVVSWSEVVSTLADLSLPMPAEPASATAADVRNLILVEHANLRRLLRRVEYNARKVLTTPVPSDSDLQDAYESAHTLCMAVASELELEDDLLAPALEAVDAWGKVRAERLRSEHAEQKVVLRSYVRALERLATSDRGGQLLVPLVQQLVDGLKEQLRVEEDQVLRPELLSDLPTSNAVETG